MNFIRHGVGTLEQAMVENPAIAVVVAVGALALILFGTMLVDGFLRRRRRTLRRRAFQNHLKKLPPKESSSSRRGGLPGHPPSDTTGTDLAAPPQSAPAPYRTQIESPR